MSDALREALSKDPIAPILWDPYYEAIDRRIEGILYEIRKCIEKHSIEDVIINA